MKIFNWLLIIFPFQKYYPLKNVKVKIVYVCKWGTFYYSSTPKPPGTVTTDRFYLRGTLTPYPDGRPRYMESWSSKESVDISWDDFLTGEFKNNPKMYLKNSFYTFGPASKCSTGWLK